MLLFEQALKRMFVNFRIIATSATGSFARSDNSKPLRNRFPTTDERPRLRSDKRSPRTYI